MLILSGFGVIGLAEQADELVFTDTNEGMIGWWPDLHEFSTVKWIRDDAASERFNSHWNKK